MEKELEFMDKIKANIERVHEKVYLVLNLNEGVQKIELTKDNHGEIKTVFNSIIISLKKNLFEFELVDDEKKDLFYDVSQAYIEQLNQEIKVVREEIKDLELNEDE